MVHALLELRLVGRLPFAIMLGVAVATAVLTVLVRRRRVTRNVLAGVCVAALAGTGAVVVNTQHAAYPTLADLLGVQRFPGLNGITPGDGGQPTGPAIPSPTGSTEATGPTGPTHPDGEVVSMTVPDTASKFGVYDAEVWLPPQYFSEPTVRFPMLVLTHGNPGRSTDWLDAGEAAQTGLAVASAGHPVILVMPTVLQQPDGDSLCVDTALEGHAETYVVRDVVAAADQQLRTIPDSRHRGIGGFSMGGFCALNLGLKHPDVFSVLLSFSSLTVCEPDAIDGGNEELFGGGDWKSQVAANSPAVYYSSLDPSKGPALWIDVGEAETELVGPAQALAGQLKAKGFAVEFQVRPGGHDFETWTAALQQSLPWAATRLGG